MPGDAQVPSIGDNLARIRRRRGLTQEQLAERADVSVSVIRKLERGDRDSASLPTLRKLAAALHVTTVELFQPTPRFEGPVDQDDLHAIRRVLQPAHTVRGLVLPRLADEEEPASYTLDAVRQAAREVNGMFRHSDYAGAVATLPLAISHARRTADGVTGDEAAAVWGQLTQIYQTAALVLTQLRHDDLAYQAAGLAADAARAAGSDVLLGAVVCTENWLLTRQARFDDAEQAALVSAEAIEPSFSRSPPSQLGVFAWLNLGAAAAATRNNRPDVAADALRRARAAAYIAAPYRSPNVEHWTEISPAVVAMREVELAMVDGDVSRALRTAQEVPADATPLVTHQRFELDVAAAHLEQRRPGEALAILLRLRETVPSWLRYQRYARSLVSRLLHMRARAVPPELRELADFLDIDD